MTAVAQLFTSGVWLVKQGKEAEFISAWRSFAEWTSQSQPAVGTAHLLQDIGNPASFLSFGPWDSQEAIRNWRQTPQFQAFIASARDLCEDIQPKTLSLVAFAAPPG